jgi:hypothetical protein
MSGDFAEKGHVVQGPVPITVERDGLGTGALQGRQ